MKIGSFARTIRASQEQTVSIETKPPSHNGAIAAAVVLLIIGAFILFTPQGQAILGQGLGFLSHPSSASSTSSLSSSSGSTSSSSSSSASSASTTSSTTSSVTVTCPNPMNATSLTSPDIHGNQASVWYPPDYCVLSGYALALINHDRASNGTNPVTLSYVPAAQQHVDSMLYHGYFAHNDTQGYKPYMRYGLLGGRGADFENVAIEFASHYASTSDVMNAIKDLEDSMMNKDLACCNNLHRANILSPLHTRVSIGIAYNSTTAYFGEEFENYYVDLNFSTVPTCAYPGSCEIVMSGRPLNPNVTANVVAVYVAFDKTPTPFTAAQLNAGPHEYDPGQLVGGVLPPCNPYVPPGCPSFASGVTVIADKWTSTKLVFDIEFSLRNFMQIYGAGVYTFYVVIGQSTDEALTSISVFVT